MRHLNKIIFINSANIPYAEVMVDGNVHFAGTQGVGKSTVLRALLFFYNADKMRLGIQQGQKSFEEFYFRQSNSFIIYEVKTGNTAYSILAMRNLGKIVYYFIDAPYQRDWLVDSGGRVESDWIAIRKKILRDRNVDISNKIDTYELYRNIIFGNTYDRTHRYDKYAIVKSSKYQNIPRSIQNVFLNSKLDADFVKNTIIQSMTDVEESISLATYRHLVADFEREFDEIDCWYRKDSNGQVAVRMKASGVVDTYRLLVAIGQEIVHAWHCLNFAVNNTREQMPIVENEIHNIKERLVRLKEQTDETRKEYNSRHEQLIREIGAIQSKLDEIGAKRKYYEKIDIASIIDLDSQSPKLEAEKRQKQDMLSALQRQFESVTDKYKTLYKGLDDELKTFDLSQKEELNRHRGNLLTEQDRLQRQRDSKKKVADDAYKEWTEASEERYAALQGSCNRADKRLSELQYWHPMEKQAKICHEEILGFQQTENERKSELAVVCSQIESLRKEGQLELDKLEGNYKVKDEALRKELERQQTELAATEGLLARWDGSLYEWLVRNKPGWESTIGKVVDEQNVLYAQGLSPELVPGSESCLFGVKVDLDAIARHHRTPDDYRTLQKSQREAIDATRQRLRALQAIKEKEISSSRKNYSQKLSELNQQKTNLSVQLQQLPVKTRDAQTRLHQIEREEEQLVAQEREKRQTAYNEARLGLEKEKDQRKEHRQSHDRETRAAENEYNIGVDALRKRFDSFSQKQKKEAEAFRAEHSARRRLMEQQERDELKGLGADTKAIDECRGEIRRLQAVLDKIARNHDNVVEFRKDEKELLSHEGEYRESKQRYEAIDVQASKDCDEKCGRLAMMRSEEQAALDKGNARCSEMKEGLKQYDQFCGIENIIPEKLLQDDDVERTSATLGDLVATMRGAINRKRQKQDDLKRAVNAFNTHFSQNNTFHFIVPQYDEDYLAFALNLQDFIDNNKIEEYRKRVSEHYNSILQSVSREVGALMNHKGEISGIINDVNRDFREHNFAGVIRSIELRSEDSSDRLVLLLRDICNFIDENALSIGEVNLFSGNNRDKANDRVVDYLKKFMKQLQREPSRTELTLSDTFRLQFRIEENDNSTGWVERINNVGSDGTDILVKAMVNIMLINVFKTKASRKHGDFIIHCMMDEIGKLHPSNVKGILQFANVRNIYLINSSPMGYNADIYKYNYLLTKDSKSRTHIKRLLTIM